MVLICCCLQLVAASFGISGLQLAACTLPSSCWLIILSRPPALEEGVVGGTLVAPCGLFHGDTNVVSHQLPSVRVGWGRSDGGFLLLLG